MPLTHPAGLPLFLILGAILTPLKWRLAGYHGTGAIAGTEPRGKITDFEHGEYPPFAVVEWQMAGAKVRLEPWTGIS